MHWGGKAVGLLVDYYPPGALRGSICSTGARVECFLFNTLRGPCGAIIPAGGCISSSCWARVATYYWGCAPDPRVDWRIFYLGILRRPCGAYSPMGWC